MCPLAVQSTGASTDFIEFSLLHSELPLQCTERTRFVACRLLNPGQLVAALYKAAPQLFQLIRQTLSIAACPPSLFDNQRQLSLC